MHLNSFSFLFIAVPLPGVVADVGDVEVDDEDEGQFQLIQEDVDEEKISLDEFGDGDGGSGRRHTGPARTRGESQEFFDNSFSAADDEWKRLEQEKKADLIAEQVCFYSPEN